MNSQEKTNSGDKKTVTEASTPNTMTVQPETTYSQKNRQTKLNTGVTIQNIECMVFGIVGWTWLSLEQIWTYRIPWLDTFIMYILLATCILNLVVCSITRGSYYNTNKILFSLVLAFWFVYVYCLAVSLAVYNPSTAISYDCVDPIDVSSLFTTVYFAAAPLHPVGAAVSLAILTVQLLICASSISGEIWHRQTQKIWGYTSLVLGVVCLNITLIQSCQEQIISVASINFIMLCFVVFALLESILTSILYIDVVLFVIHIILSIMMITYTVTWDPRKIGWQTALFVLILNGINSVYAVPELVTKYNTAKQVTNGDITPHPGPTQTSNVTHDNIQTTTEDVNNVHMQYHTGAYTGYTTAENTLFRSVVLQNLSKKQT